jgi:hypothetical protein
VTPREFYDRCERHDWHFAMSDDGRAYAAGRQEHLALQAEAAGDRRLKAIYAAWSARAFSGPGYGTSRAKRPRRPR